MLNTDIYEYWTVRKDYSGEAAYSLDRDKLKEDIGEPVTEALMTFLAAHYKYNDKEEPASEAEKAELELIMNSAISILGSFDRFAFVDSLNALKRGVALGTTRISLTALTPSGESNVSHP